MKLHRRILVLVGLIVAGLAQGARADAVSVLEEQKDLTPEAFARNFAGFSFELNSRLQDAEAFLQRRRGDCDDFASLASQVLSARGYKTKLVVVMMEQQSHVVCYVPEAGGFLDFNHRADARPVVESDGSLEGIARRVAQDFGSRWQMVSEFKYQNRQPIYLDNVFPSPVSPAKNSVAARPMVGTNSPVLLTTISSPTLPGGIAGLANSRAR